MKVRLTIFTKRVFVLLYVSGLQLGIRGFNLYVKGLHLYVTQNSEINNSYTSLEGSTGVLLAAKSERTTQFASAWRHGLLWFVRSDTFWFADLAYVVLILKLYSKANNRYC